MPPVLALIGFFVTFDVFTDNDFPEHNTLIYYGREGN